MHDAKMSPGPLLGPARVPCPISVVNNDKKVKRENDSEGEPALFSLLVSGRKSKGRVMSTSRESWHRAKGGRGGGGTREPRPGHQRFEDT